MFVCSFADVRTLYAASYDSDRVVQFNSTSGFTYILPGKKHEIPGAGTLKVNLIFVINFVRKSFWNSLIIN